jgi:hypothetical protein
MVNTSKVTDRRSLRFNSIGELAVEVDRLAAAERTGKLRRNGNWTLGQICGHLAAWINYAYDGFPMGPPPWLIRVILRSRVKKYLRDGMPAGVRIPKVKNGTFATEPLSVEEGTERLRRAIKRLQSGEPARFDSPAFGKLSDEQRIALNLRHAELHLGFLHP